MGAGGCQFRCQNFGAISVPGETFLTFLPCSPNFSPTSVVLFSPPDKEQDVASSLGVLAVAAAGKQNDGF